MTKRPFNEENYLDTIDRKRLDFDFEKVCSVTLSNINVYCCLVCGKYFQGRSTSSPAYFHSINDNHRIFMSFNNLKAYCLPENYLIETDTLEDIKYSIEPKYTESQVKLLDKKGGEIALDLNGNPYEPGYVGLNNIKHNDYANVIIQLLAHITPIRNHNLLLDSKKINDELLKRLSILVKKIWSSKLFKPHVSPHELLQYINILSNKSYTINEQKDPKDFLLWLVNIIIKHEREANGSSTVMKSIQGRVKITSQKFTKEETENDVIKFTESKEVTETVNKFLLLTLDLPPVSLFKDGFGIKQLPQVNISTLLNKFTGKEEIISNDEIKKYEIVKFPSYLILHFNRFKDSKLNIDLNTQTRNQTIVQFPLELKFGEVKYKLIGNIINDIESNLKIDEKSLNNWKIQLNTNEKWIEIDNIHLKPKEEQLLFLSESYLQVWKRVK